MFNILRQKQIKNIKKHPTSSRGDNTSSIEYLVIRRRTSFTFCLNSAFLLETSRLTALELSNFFNTVLFHTKSSQFATCLNHFPSRWLFINHAKDRQRNHSMNHYLSSKSIINTTQHGLSPPSHHERTKSAHPNYTQQGQPRGTSISTTLK